MQFCDYNFSKTINSAISQSLNFKNIPNSLSIREIWFLNLMQYDLPRLLPKCQCEKLLMTQLQSGMMCQADNRWHKWFIWLVYHFPQLELSRWQSEQMAYLSIAQTGPQPRPRQRQRPRLRLILRLPLRQPWSSTFASASVTVEMAIFLEKKSHWNIKTAIKVR
jgi:hypothetical protein